MNLWNLLKKLYGSEKKKNKSAIYMGLSFFAAGILMLILLLYNKTDTPSMNAIIYGISVFESSALFSFCSYFFSKEERKDKFKIVKYISFLISVLLLAIVFLPVFFVVALTKKIKFNSFVTHSEKYVITTIIPFFVTFILGLLLFMNLRSITWLKASTISMLAAFIVWRLLAFGILKLFSLSKKFSKQDYLSIKKDINVLIFATITVVTFLTNCINFSDLFKTDIESANLINDLVDGITKAFAIYIAIDRLYAKWKGFNSDFEKKIEQATEKQNGI